MSERQYTEEMFEQVRAKDIKDGQYLMRWQYDTLSVFHVHQRERSVNYENHRPIIIFTYKVSDGIVIQGQRETERNGDWSEMELREVDFTCTPPVATVVQYVPASRLLYVLKSEYEPR